MKSLFNAFLFDIKFFTYVALLNYNAKEKKYNNKKKNI
jgi:hypothetical protein